MIPGWLGLLAFVVTASSSFEQELASAMADAEKRVERGLPALRTRIVQQRFNPNKVGALLQENVGDLGRTMTTKGGGKSPDDDPQTQKIKKIQKNGNRLAAYQQELEAKKTELDERIKTSTTKLESNGDYMKRELEKVKSSWQGLANELRNIIKSKERQGEDAHQLQTESLKKTFQLVSSLFVFTKNKFNDMKGKIAEEEGKMQDMIYEKELLVQKKAKEAKAELVKKNKKSAKTQKKMIKTTEKKLGKVVKTVTKNLQTLMKAVKGMFRQSDKNIKKDTGVNMVLMNELRTAGDTIQDSAVSTSVSYKELDELSASTFEEMERAMDISTQEFAAKVTKNITGLKSSLTDKARSQAKQIKKIEALNKKVTKQTADSASVAVKAFKRALDTTEKAVTLTTSDAAAEVGASKQALAKFMDMSEAKIEVIKKELGTEKTKIKTSSATMKEQWQTDAVAMSESLEEEWGGVKSRVTQMSDTQQAALAAGNANLAANLKAVKETADLGLEGMATKLAAVKAVNIEAFDDSSAWMGEFGDLLNDFEGVESSWEKESTLMTGDMNADIAKAIEGNKNAIGMFQGDLVKSLTNIEKSAKGNVANSEQKAAGEASEAQKGMGSQTDSAVKVLDAEVDKEETDISGLDNEVGSSFKKNRDKDAANNEGAQKNAKDLLKAEEDVRKNGESLHSAENGMKGSLAHTAVFFGSQTREAVAAAQAEMGSDLSQGSEQLHATMDDELRHTKDSVGGEVKELTSVERAVQEGMGDTDADNEKMEKRVHKLRTAAAKLNKDLSAEFNRVKATLSAEKLKTFQTDEELNAAWKENKEKMEKLYQARIAQMSEDDKEQYHKSITSRRAAMDDLMSDSSKTFNEKKAALAEWGGEVSNTLGDLEVAARISETELQQIHANMTLTENLVNREVSDAHNKISADELLAHDTEEGLVKALDDRADGLRKAMSRSGADLSGELGGQVNAVLGNSKAAIKRVMEENKGNDEVIKREIEKIDAEVKSKLAKLSTNQVATEHQLASFEESQGEFDGDVQGQMAALRNVLKDGQYNFIQQLHQEHQLLQDQANQMAGLMENLMASIDQQSERTGVELSAEEQEQKVQMEKLLMSVKSSAAELNGVADEALHTANQSQQRAESTESMTESELESLETKISTVSGRIQTDAINMKQRLADQQMARRKETSGEKGFLMNSASSVLEQIQFIADILSQAAVKSKTKQTDLTTQLSDLKQLIEKYAPGGPQAPAASLAPPPIAPQALAEIDSGQQQHSLTAGKLLQQVNQEDEDLNLIKRMAERGESSHAATQERLYVEASGALAGLQKATSASLVQSHTDILQNRVRSLAGRLAKQEQSVGEVEKENEVLRARLLSKLQKKGRRGKGTNA